MMKYERKYQHLYNARWNKASKAYLRKHPLCVYCLQVGRTTRATLTDHKTPHKGSIKLFWDVAGNWQALCKHCHDSVKAREEARGSLPGCDADGLPVDVNHFWNKE